MACTMELGLLTQQHGNASAGGQRMAACARPLNGFRPSQLSCGVSVYTSAVPTVAAGAARSEACRLFETGAERKYTMATRIPQVTLVDIHTMCRKVNVA